MYNSIIFATNAQNGKTFLKIDNSLAVYRDVLRFKTAQPAPKTVDRQ